MPNPDLVARALDAVGQAKAPMAIVGGAGWDLATGAAFGHFAQLWGIPVAAAFRRQDAIHNTHKVWAGNLGY
ncbi:thiamine pyrophosphate-binding protein, partial [Escherichia coli]